MSAISRSPLAALTAYYRRLEADPDQTIASFGFSQEKVHFQIILEADGTLSGLEDLREPNSRGKPVPRLMLLPDGGGRSGSSISPFFCWDNTGYALGSDNKGRPERAAAMFAAFRELHVAMRDAVGADPGFAALCKFLEKWDPGQAQALPNWGDVSGMNLVFRLRAQEAFVHQSDDVQRAWLSMVSSADERVVRGPSLISGDIDDLARLHPMIRGVTGASTMGAAIVSFNLDAFESYGKSQSYNSPVGVRDAFRYTTALNRLLAENGHRIRIGDATTVFWAEKSDASDAEAAFAELFGDGVSKSDAAESGRTLDRVRGFLKAAREGRIVDYVRDPDSGFYVLGLSPNAARINVRFWLAGTVAEFARRLARHETDMEIAGAREDDPPLLIRRLLLETAREPKDVPPQLAGEMTRAVLGGTPYPRTLLSAVIRRVRAEGELNHRRAAILKAYLSRNLRQEVPVALEKDHPDETYHLGRLFAALEKTQEDATVGKLNKTIKDRYFSAASSTPAAVFPQLMRLHQHHMNKIDNMGQRITRERLVGEICGHITHFAKHLTLEKQGLFYIAYYHQRQDFFTKKADNLKETDNAK